MKQFLKFMLFSSFIALVITSCKKDENKVIYEDGTAPVASSSISGSVVLLKPNKDNPLVQFTWTNPEYRMNTGVNSQDVYYAVQVQKAGGTTWATGASTRADLFKNYTVGEMNDFLTKAVESGGLGIDPEVATDINIRVKSYMGVESATNATNLYSNVMKLNVTAYSVDPDLWITGDATPSGWVNNPPAEQKFTYSRPNNNFTLEITLPSNQSLEGYKFLTVSGQWQPQWGGAPATGGTIVENPGTGSDPAAIKPPAVAGLYRLTVSLVNKTLTVVKL